MWVQALLQLMLRLLLNMVRVTKRGNRDGATAVLEGKPALGTPSGRRGDGGGATRLGEPKATPARGAPSLARTPGRPRSPWRGGRAHSGGTGAGSDVAPAGQRQQQIRLVDHDSGLGRTETQGSRTQSLSDTRSRTGCPLTSQRPTTARRQERARPLLWVPPRVPPTPAAEPGCWGKGAGLPILVGGHD